MSTTYLLQHAPKASILEREASKLVELAKESNIAFDLEKTELMHWGDTLQAKEETIKLPNGEIVEPKPVIKWLGIFFDSSLKFKHHVSTEIAKARNAFMRIGRLANIDRGLTPFALRQLYIACVTSIADYGTVIWWNNQSNPTTKLQALQNLSIRKILGVFKTAPILPMEVESALPPPEIRINASIRAYAFRLRKLHCKHPVNEAIHKLLHPTEEPPRNAEPLQLERIYKSISHIMDDENIGLIKPFYFPPWQRETPYMVHISKLSKSDETKEHLKALQSHHSNHISIYTDASSISDKKAQGIGVGIAITKAPYENYHKQITKNIGPNNLVYDGELEGATIGAEYAETMAKPGLHFHIYSDNQAGLWRLKTPSDNPGQANQIRAINAAKEVVKKGATIEYHWVPGHEDIPGNEKADALAKGATMERPSTEINSYAMMGMRLKQLARDEWNRKLERDRASRTPQTHFTYRDEFPWQINNELKVPMGTSREIASAFYQLKTGHGRFRDYLYRMGHRDFDICWCGARETPKHLLLSCKLYGKERAKLKDYLQENNPSIRTLMTTTRGIYATIEFIKDTKIATRQWLTLQDYWFEGGDYQ